MCAETFFVCPALGFETLHALALCFQILEGRLLSSFGLMIGFECNGTMFYSLFSSPVTSGP